MTEYWLKNTINLIEDKNLKTGEFEDSLGVSTGYLSRQKSKVENGERSNPSAELILKISKELNISMDILMNYDIPTSQDNLNTLDKVLEKIIVDTNNKRIVWDEYSKEYLKSKGDLFTRDLFYRDVIGDNTPPDLVGRVPEEDYLELSDEITFHSQFNADAVINGNCYEGRLSEKEHIYLVDVVVNNSQGWELYMGKEEELDTIFEGMFTTLKEPTNALLPKVDSIIESINRNRKDAYIGLALRNMIDSYMNN